MTSAGTKKPSVVAVQSPTPAAAATSEKREASGADGRQGGGVGLVEGFLEHLQKGGLLGTSKVWKRQYVALIQNSDTGVLSLHGYDTAPSAVSPESRRNSFRRRSTAVSKPKWTMELEEGCEVRPTEPAEGEGGGNKFFNFMVVTSKTQIRFRTEEEEERQLWLTRLAGEFESAMQLHIDDQKIKMLRRGQILTLHRGGGGEPVSCKVWLGSSNNEIHIGDAEVIPAANIDFVSAGNEAEGFRGATAFHFNCFVLRLKSPSSSSSSSSPNGDVVNIGSGEKKELSIALEAPKQSTRDDWVSALELWLRNHNTSTNITTGGGGGGGGTARRMNNNNNNKGESGGGKRVVISLGHKENPHNSLGSSSSSSSSPNHAGGMGGAGFASTAATTLNNNNNSSPPSNSNSGSSSTTNTTTTTNNNNAARGTRGVSLASEMEDDEEDGGESEEENGGGNVAGSKAGGVGDMFKQKVKLGKGFPYSRCISHALEETLNGESAGNVLTPHREVNPKEMEEVRGYLKLELPESPIVFPEEESSSGGAGKKKKTLPKSTRKPVKFEMHEYAPAAFKELRNRYGITDLNYFRSLSTLSGDGAVGDGKSGMLFFFTQDRRYVLKTVKANEMAVLVDQGLLPAYLKHMMSNPDSLICRFFGLYRFKMGPSSNKKDIFLVCMQNSFDTRLVLHEKYDLKGSTRNRWCTPRFGSVLKDLNFGNSKLYLDLDERADLLKQVDKDTEILEKFNVMDYSLLLGIHKPQEEPERVRRNLVLLAMADKLEERGKNSNNPNTSNPASAYRLPSGSVSGNGSSSSLLQSSRPVANRWQRDFGGVQMEDGETHRPIVYILCVIDILQAYDLGKKAENLIKSQRSNTEDKNEISAVNPKTYRARFIAYLAKIIVGVPGGNVKVAESRKAIKIQLANLRIGLTSLASEPLQTNYGEQAGEDDRINKKRDANLPQGAGLQLEDLEEDEEDEEEDLLGLGGDESAPSSKVPATFSRPSLAPPPPTSSAKDAASPPPVPLSSPRDTKAKLKEETASSSSSSTSTSNTNPTRIKSMRKKSSPAALQAEIEAAVKAAEKEKKDMGADYGFTETLEDGTEITMLEEGGFLQRNPDGVVIRQFKDGSLLQTNVDGSSISTSSSGKMVHRLADGTEILHMEGGGEKGLVDIQKNVDGSVLERYESGFSIQRNNDGSRIEISPDGSTRLFAVDGTVVERLKNGSTKQTSPDGVTILIETNGNRVQTSTADPGTVLTIFPDGSRRQEDSSTGNVITISADGEREEHRFPDGTLVVRSRKEGNKQINPDGTVIKLP